MDKASSVSVFQCPKFLLKLGNELKLADTQGQMKIKSCCRGFGLTELWSKQNDSWQHFCFQPHLTFCACKPTWNLSVSRNLYWILMWNVWQSAQVLAALCFHIRKVRVKEMCSKESTWLDKKNCYRLCVV